MKLFPHLRHVCTTGIEILFPPSDDEVLFRREYERIPLLAVLRTDTNFSSLLPYQEPVVRAAIHLNKYHYHARAQRVLASALEPVLITHFPDHLILPIPLSGKRYRERGYNQVETVLQHLPSVTVDRTILRRKQHTTPQSGLPRAKRLTNVEEAFSVTKPHLASNQHLLIVDDVVTTGATLKAARAKLAPHAPASITCLAFAH